MSRRFRQQENPAETPESPFLIPAQPLDIPGPKPLIFSVQRYFCGIFILTVFVFTANSCITVPQGQETYHPVTEDGFPLTLERFKPGKITKPYPVILCHGLMATRKYYKFNGERSLAMALQKEGYDVWLLDLRGREDAGSPGYYFGERTYSYNLDDYFKKDMDTALSTVLTKTGKSGVNWIGHSMGGMVAYARLGTMRENRIKNLVTIGSPFLFTLPGENFQIWNSGSSLTEYLPVIPTGCLGKISSYSCISLAPNAYFGEMLWYEPNLPDGMVRKAERYASNNIATGVAKQFSDAVNHGGLRSADQSVDYVEKLGNVKVPAMLVAGRRDHLAPARVVREIYERIGSEDKSLYIAGRAEGSSADYGHTDLFIGSGSYEDVVVPVIRWLNQRNGDNQ